MDLRDSIFVRALSSSKLFQKLVVVLNYHNAYLSSSYDLVRAKSCLQASYHVNAFQEWQTENYTVQFVSLIRIFNKCLDLKYSN